MRLGDRVTASEVSAARLVFVGGLHRSGTTPFASILAEHPDISGLTQTPAVENEGQHLQSVYPPAKVYGGSGHFARDGRAHLTESSPLVSQRNAKALLDAWSPYWDLSRRWLLEKSPPNLVMSRFLQALYPEASFIMVVRHPVTVALSTKKWTRLLSRSPQRYASLSTLVEHWLVAHRTLLADIPFLHRVHIVHYEDLMQAPDRMLEQVREFLRLDDHISSAGFSVKHGEYYQERWEDLTSPTRPGHWQRRLIERRHSDELLRFGYDVNDLSRYLAHEPQLLA
jgi:Sulfotransferase family